MVPTSYGPTVTVGFWYRGPSTIRRARHNTPQRPMGCLWRTLTAIGVGLMPRRPRARTRPVAHPRQSNIEILMSAFWRNTSALPQEQTSRWGHGMTACVKGCRTPAVSGCQPRDRSAGVGQASGEETAGVIRLGGAGGSVYGDLTVAGWLAGIAGSAGWQGFGQRRHRRDGFATTFR